MGWTDSLINVLPEIIGTGFGMYAAGQGGGKSDVTYSQSPQQQQIWQYLQPLMGQISQQAQGGSPFYSIPGINPLMPTSDWYQNISPEVMSGILAPYEDASKQLTESLGGSAGSAMGGASGMLGASQAKFWEQAGRNMGTQAWSMTQPALSSQWQAQLQQNQMPYSIATSLLGGTYPNTVIQPDTSFNWGNALMGGLGAYGMMKQYPW